MHKQGRSMHKAMCCAPGLRVCTSVSPGCRPLRPRAARVRSRVCAPLHQIKRGIGEGGGKTPGWFHTSIYIISHPRVHLIPKRVPTKLTASLRNMPLKNFKNQTKRPCCVGLACLLQAGESSLFHLSSLHLVLSGARNTRQARRAQHRGTAWASNRTSEQRRARR